jgi:hypothetical protein
MDRAFVASLLIQGKSKKVKGKRIDRESAIFAFLLFPFALPHSTVHMSPL